MLKVYMTMGLPASGKTKWAMEKLAENPNGIKRVCKDDLRAMLDGGRYSSDAEKFILNIRDALVSLALGEGKHVIVDDTNLSLKHLARIDQLVAGKAIIEIVDFTDVPVDTCIERDLARPNSVGSKVIWRMYWQFLHKPKEPTERNPELPDVVVVDLDGTLALHNGRGPYEFEKLDTDRTNPAVQTIIEWANENAKVIIVSGREASYKEATEKWLATNGVAYDDIFMRETDDKRRDDVVKREIYEQNIKGRFNVIAILDDRDRTVSMWRSLGLPCFQVNYGTF